MELEVQVLKMTFRVIRVSTAANSESDHIICYYWLLLRPNNSHYCDFFSRLIIFRGYFLNCFLNLFFIIAINLFGANYLLLFEGMAARCMRVGVSIGLTSLDVPILIRKNTTNLKCFLN